jgi:ABC-type lipoprotein release transport system permease subunit
MDNYANPPVHGVHYLRVETPEEATAISKTMPQERWEEMSAACKSWWETNASCEGSFKLTKKLCVDFNKESLTSE